MGGDLFIFALRHADNALVLGNRVSEWCGVGPYLEEDIALTNLALDLIGQARLLYSFAGEVENQGRDEDALAYLRDQGEFRNVLLVEQPNGDFAQTIVRHLLFSAYAHPLYEELRQSANATLAAIAAKAEKEMAYHVRHAGEWVVRLGDGTEQSRARAQAALDELWTYTGELFERDATEERLIAEGVSPDLATIEARWRETVEGIVSQATLSLPEGEYMQQGGRQGRHSEHLGHMLAEMQILQRTYPGAAW